MFNPRTFPCPNCKEIINDGMQTCRFCSAPVDPQAAKAAAELQSKVNQACSDASYTRTTAMVMLVFLGLSMLPFLPLVEGGFVVTFLAVLVMLVRWQVKFGGLQTGDADYQTAKRLRNLALIIWFAALPLGFIVRPIISILFAALVSG